MRERRGPVAPERVLDFVEDEADLIVPLANGEPVGLLDVLEEHHERLNGVRVHQMHALHERDYMHAHFGSALRHVSYFLSPATRAAYWAGCLDFVPVNFSEMPRTLRDHTRCSMVICAASRPDAHGHFSLGTNADYVATLIGKVPFFLEVNAQMPRTFGSNQIHESQVAGWSEVDRPLVEVPPVQPDERDHAIAARIVDRIPDRATLQAGIGGIPNAVLAGLRGHRDLGLHTELLSDGVVDLVEEGVMTGVYKQMRANKLVATFALGTRRLYDFMDQNSAVDMVSVDWVNDPRRIGREKHFVSINATTEVDLYGQCASETIVGRYYSGSGGQADFARGAMYSEGGQAFVVLHATTSKGRSRIRTQLSQGSVVTTVKNTVDNVVTEYGIAELRGRSVADRARQLIAIAAPEHRDELEAEARAAGMLPKGIVVPTVPKGERRSHAAAPAG